MKRTSSSSQLREEEGMKHHGVILPSDAILKHESPIQALHGNRTSDQDFLGLPSGFVNLMWMLSAPEMHILSVNAPCEVKVGLITKPNVFQSVRILLQMITEFFRKAFLDTQLSETGRHGSCTDACVDWFEVCAMLSKAVPHFLWLSHRLPC
jgi:hypothetical protein